MSVSKKTIIFFWAGVLGLAQGLQASSGPYDYDNPATKLGRGLTNVITSPGEYIVQTNKLMETNDPITAYFAGAAQGTVRMLERIGGGLYEIVTFPIPLPKKYKPLMDPPTTAAALDDSGVLKAN